MLKSMLAASLAAKGGNGDGQPAGRFATAVNVAADAVRQAAPSLEAEGRQAAATAMQAMLDQARAVMASRPDLSPATGAPPGNGSGGAAAAIDLRDWDTRKADEARDSFVVTALRLVSDACFNLGPAGAAGAAALAVGPAGNAVLIDLATNLSVHLDHLKPELAASGSEGGNGGSVATGFPAFVHNLRDLVAKIRK